MEPGIQKEVIIHKLSKEAFEKDLMTECEIRLGFSSFDAASKIIDDEDSTFERQATGEVVLSKTCVLLYQKLNSNLPQKALDNAYYELTQDLSNETPIDANQFIYSRIKNGIKVQFKDNNDKPRLVFVCAMRAMFILLISAKIRAMGILEKQREFFDTGKTRDLNFRLNILKTLKKAILRNSTKILIALKQDLNKSKNEAFFSEIYPVIEEINFFIKNLKKWEAPKRVKTPLMQFSSKSLIYNEPYGVVLIISPWNYPFQLPLMPLIGAIASGNCAILKLSEYSVKTSDVTAKILKEVFIEQHVYPVLGGAEVIQNLLKEKFDYIFYTGNSTIGKEVMMAPSNNLTPVTLELGGKSPCIIDRSANIA